MIDCRGGHANPLDGFVVQDGAIPQGLGAFFQILLQFLPAFQSGYGRTFTQRLHAIMAWLKGILMGCVFNTGALHRTQAFVAMLHDSTFPAHKASMVKMDLTLAKAIRAHCALRTTSPSLTLPEPVAMTEFARSTHFSAKSPKPSGLC